MKSIQKLFNTALALVVLLVFAVGIAWAADTKLSALTELAVAPAGSDQIYINDGGVSKRITVDNLFEYTIDTLTLIDAGGENAEFYPILVDGATGTQVVETDGGLTYNPAQDRLTAGGFSGDGLLLTGVVLDSEIDSLSELETFANGGAYMSDMLAATNEANFKSIVNLEANTDFHAPGGTDIPVADGGTGASTAAAARTALGLAIGSDVLAPDGDGSGLTGVDADTVDGQNAIRIVVSDADADPTVNDDTDGSPTAATPDLSGYRVGDIYVNGTADPEKYFVCVDNSNGAADWDQLNPGQVTISTNGLIARTGAGTASARTLTAGRSLTVTNGDGVSGAPDFVADAELYTHTECIYIEDPTADDDLQSIYRNSTANDFTITEIWAESDQTVNFDLQIDDGSPADVNGTDISPAAGEAEDTSLSGDTTLAANEELDLAVTSVSGTPTWVSICWTYTVND